MLFCVVDLPLDPPRAGTRRRIPVQVVDLIATIRERVPRWLAQLGVDSAPIEQWDQLTRDQCVLVRTGTIYADRRIVWRKG